LLYFSYLIGPPGSNLNGGSISVLHIQCFILKEVVLVQNPMLSQHRVLFCSSLIRKPQMFEGKRFVLLSDQLAI